VSLDGVPEYDSDTHCKMVACVVNLLFLRHWIILRIDMLLEWAVVNGVCKFRQSLLRCESKCGFGSEQ